jgi:hypothetical protein
MKTIKKGKKGNDVIQLQEYLLKLGYSLKIDGDFSNITENLVRDFQTNHNLSIDGVVGPKTWETLEKEVAKLEEMPTPVILSKVIFDNSLSEYKKNIVNSKNLEIFAQAGTVSNNPEIIITSTIRTPLEQATAMYDNEKAGNKISYAAPGREVIEVYNDNKSKSKSEVIKLMVEKIEILAVQGQLTSRHCVPESIYLSKNIIDISKTRTPNPRDLVNALLEYQEVSKVITPIGYLSTYNKDKRVSIDAKEPAIHIEF